LCGCLALFPRGAAPGRWDRKAGVEVERPQRKAEDERTLRGRPGGSDRILGVGRGTRQGRVGWFQVILCSVEERNVVRRGRVWGGACRRSAFILGPGRCPATWRMEWVPGGGLVEGWRRLILSGESPPEGGRSGETGKPYGSLARRASGLNVVRARARAQRILGGPNPSGWGHGIAAGPVIAELAQVCNVISKRPGS